MKKVFSLGEFYGVTRKSMDSESFAFVEINDFQNSNVPKHTHESAHFFFIINGKYEANVKGINKLCSSLTTLFHPAGTTHKDHFKSENGHFLTVSLKPDINKMLFEELNFFKHSVIFNSSEISWIGKKILREIYSSDNLSEIVLEGLANELLVYSTRNLRKLHKPPPWLKTAYELINDCCLEEITISEIADTVGVHPIHLARTFRQFFDCSPGEYLRLCRIDYAANLLLTSKKSLSEIALLSGFSDQSHFTHSFKRNVGFTPKSFREENN